MKLITFNQLISSLEATKEYIDNAVGNISTSGNDDSYLLVTFAYEEVEGEAVPVLSSHSSTEILAAIAEGKNVIVEGTQATIHEVVGNKVVISVFNTYSDTALYTNATAIIDADKSVEVQEQKVYSGAYIDYLEAVINTKAGSGHTHDEYITQIELDDAIDEAVTNDLTKAEIEDKLTGLIGSHQHNYTITKTPNNTITSISDDTVSTWGYHCNSVHWFTQDNCLIDQPHEWGFLQNYSTGGTEVHQLWFSQPGGDMLHRGGNESGWTTSWKAILDSYNYTTYIPKSSASNYTNAYVWIDGSGTTFLGDKLEFHNGVVDTYNGYNASIVAVNSTDYLKHAIHVWGHWNSGDVMGSWDLGSEDYQWGSVYAYYGLDTSSDRNLKENINYIRNNEILLMNSMEDEIEEQDSNNFTYSDLYDFVKTDLELATYNYKGKEKNSLGFIAQDLLYNADGTDSKIGQLIVPPVTALTESELEEKKAKFESARKREATAEELKELSTPKLEYNQTNYISVLAGALKEAINEIELLKEIVNKQQEIIDQLLEAK